MRRCAILALAAFLLAACGSSGHTSTPATTEPTTASIGTDTTTPSLNTIKHWATTWCTLRPTMTKAQLIAAMGEPTSTFGAPTPQIGWEASDFSITAFFDDLGNTKQIQVSPPPSTPEERALFPCSLETKFRSPH